MTVVEQSNIIIYQTEDGQTHIDVRLENETVWLTQAQMAELFQKDQSVVARHINNALKEGELDDSNMHFLHNTQYKYRPTKVYDLDVIISVGYRVELYPSVEEKAAMLLYLVTKNHSFSDGNKRIAATLFLWFLNNNGILYRQDGSKRIADNTLVALTLMIAESKTEEKDVMVKVVVNLINQKN